MNTTDHQKWCADPDHAVMSGRARGARGRWLPEPHVPAGPLVAAVGGRVVLLRHPVAVQAAYYRARRAGWLTVACADRLASELLGEHPATVWGPSWWEAA